MNKPFTNLPGTLYAHTLEKAVRDPSEDNHSLTARVSRKDFRMLMLVIRSSPLIHFLIYPSLQGDNHMLGDT